MSFLSGPPTVKPDCVRVYACFTGSRTRRRINLTGERVSRLEGFITEIAENVAVDLCWSRSGDDVDHAAVARVFRVVLLRIS